MAKLDHKESVKKAWALLMEAREILNDTGEIDSELLDSAHYYAEFAIKKLDQYREQEGV